jgi:hypothetical protein
MGLLNGIMPGEWEAQGGLLDTSGGIGNVLNGNNPLFNIGLGILANNNSRNLGQVLGRGIAQGVGQTQQARAFGLQNRRLENIERRENRMDAQLEADLEQTRKRNEAIQRAIEKNPELADLYAIDPKAAIKQAFPNAGDPAEYGLVPQIGVDPQSGQQRFFIQDKSGNTKWLNAAVPPKPQFVAPTEYNPGYWVDPRNPNAQPVPIQTPSQPQSGGYGMPQSQERTDPRAPWANLSSPKQIDEAKQRAYQDASKYIAEIDASVKNYGDTQAQLDRFLELNRKQSTGSLADRSGLPSLDSDKREMEALQAQLAPKVREPGSGTTSDRDIGLYLQGLPGVDKPGDVNTNLINTSRKAYQKALEKQSFYNAYLQEYGHLNGAAELFERDYAANHAKERESKPKQSTMNSGGWSAKRTK